MFKIIILNFHLEKIFWILKVNVIYIMFSTMLFAFLAGLYAYFTSASTYEAQISFYVYSNPDYITDSTINISSTEIAQAKGLLASYMQILESNSFLDNVREETQLNYGISELRSRIRASAVDNTAVFIVSVFDENPSNAMNIANAIGQLAPDEIVRIIKSGGIEVLDAAELPTLPYQTTNVLKYAFVGGICGLVIAFSFAMLKGLLNTTIRRKYEIEDMFTIPILGDIPAMLSENKKDVVNKVLNQNSPFEIKEAYNNMRANLLFTGKDEKCPVYAVTSADVGEGKTLSTVNLGISYAHLGKKVLIIDGDMRKGGLGKLLRLENSIGLSEFLAGVENKLSIQEYIDNLYVLSAGNLPLNPSELLSGHNGKILLEKCKEEYDVIFIDLPPVGIVADALSLAKEATAFILVVREKVTRFEREKMIVRKLEALDANICGFLYNGISMKSQDYIYKNKDYDNWYHSASI